MNRYGARAVAGLLVALQVGGMAVMAEETTTLQGVKQPPLNTTMMGMLKGAADYHGLGLSAPMVFGLSGHAFLINIHKQLCPSGPYCWERKKMKPLIANMGLEMTDLGFFGTGTPEADKLAIDAKLRAALDAGTPCSLMNLENQLIDAYDGDGFSTAQPWAPNMKFPPDTLSFGTWKEFGKRYHVNFYTLGKVEPADRLAAVLASLDYGIELHREPAKHCLDGYGVGPDAYDLWINTVPTNGSKHGNWWNGVVWAECREMAAKYMTEIGEAYPAVSAPCAQLSSAYEEIGEALRKASDKKLGADEKIELLKQTKALEAATVTTLEQLAAALRAVAPDDSTP
jgi:hypothetical protein